MDIASPQWKDMIVDGARDLGVDVRPEQADQFVVHATILKAWHRKINLTAIDSPRDMAVKHFLDSIAPSRFIKPGSRLLDAGSGAGFPGIPLKIMIPSLDVTLVDATRKKVSFLKHVIQTLHLSRISALHSRLEDLQQEQDGGFDLIICRAFSSLTEFVEKSLPLLAPGGLLLACKGKELATDMRQVSTRNGSDVFLVTEKGDHTALQLELVKFKLPFLNLSRTLVLMRRF